MFWILIRNTSRNQYPQHIFSWREKKKKKKKNYNKKKKQTNKQKKKYQYGLIEKTKPYLGLCFYAADLLRRSMWKVKKKPKNAYLKAYVVGTQ